MGVAAWYKRLSAYGENYLRPMTWLGAVMLLFSVVVYPFAGLDYDSGGESSAARPASLVSNVVKLTYFNPCPGSTKTPSRACLSRVQLIGHSLVMSLYVAGFQRGLVYEPSYPWGRILALLEAPLSSTLVALFLLAVRRQFKR